MNITDKIDQYIIEDVNEADFIDLGMAKKNIDDTLKHITTMEDWLNMAKSFVVSGKRDDALKVSVAINKKSIMLAKAVKKIPSRRITNLKVRRNKMV